jgi:fructokinase
MTVLTKPVSVVADEGLVGADASRVLEDTRLTTFGTGHIGHDLRYCAGRVIPTRDLAARGRSTSLASGASNGIHAARRRDAEVARIDEMISRSDIVKLSDEDLSWLRAGERHGDAIRWLMSRGPAILIVTHRSTAVTGYTRSGSVHVPGHRVQVARVAEWEEAFADALVDALTARDLLDHRNDRNLRAIGLDDLRAILHDANVTAAQAATPTID